MAWNSGVSLDRAAPEGARRENGSAEVTQGSTKREGLRARGVSLPGERAATGGAPPTRNPAPPARPSAAAVGCPHARCAGSARWGGVEIFSERTTVTLRCFMIGWSLWVL